MRLLSPQHVGPSRSCLLSSRQAKCVIKVVPLTSGGPEDAKMDNVRLGENTWPRLLALSS